MASVTMAVRGAIGCHSLTDMRFSSSTYIWPGAGLPVAGTRSDALRSALEPPRPPGVR
ncbi:MAG: hypothetical protein V7646_5225 [Pseudonocardia sp.]|jgi:hypothetical protein